MSELKLQTTTPDADEDASAKSYWSTTEFQSRGYGKRPPHYAREIARLIVGLGASSVLEFGCNAGRNLELLGQAAAAAGAPVPRRLGLDINAESIAVGVDEWGLDLRVGDELMVAEMEPGSWDLVFTVSVIDHIPHPRSALEALARAAGRWLLLLEPHDQHTGRVEQYRSAFVDGEGEVTPFSYVHDYDRLLGELGMTEVLDIPMPTGLARLGPLYRLRLLAADPSAAAAHPAQLSADSFHRAAVLALLEERQFWTAKSRNLHAQIKELKAQV